MQEDHSKQTTPEQTEDRRGDDSGERGSEPETPEAMAARRAELVEEIKALFKQIAEQGESP
jgi:hypothetical protein